MSDDEIPIDELVDGLALEEDPLGADLDDRDVDSEIIGGQVVNWRTLHEEDAPETWSTLRDWVDWLCSRYDVPETTIPDCWWKHGALVEELSALHSAWLASFDETDSGYGPIGWHERWAIAKDRLRKTYSGGCRNGHKEQATRVMPPGDAEWEDWVTAPHGS